MSSTSFALLTAKKPAKKAESKPIKTAEYSCVEKSPETKYIPPITRSPKENSNHENRFFIIMGSNHATCKVVVERHKIPSEAVDHWMEV